MSEQQFCTFYLGEHYFGVPVSEVQEIIRYQDMTRVPLAPDVVSGLINLRGQIVTAIDLRKRLEFEAKKDDKKLMNVVVRTIEGAVSLQVDEIGDVLEVPDDCFERCPETLTGSAREMIWGAYKLENKLLLILDTGKAINL